MVGIKLRDTPEITTSAGDDVVHVNTTGTEIDSHITKTNFLQEVQTQLDAVESSSDDNASDITNLQDEAKTTFPLTGGGALQIRGQVQELLDSATYVLPEAATVGFNQYINLIITDKTASLFTPSVVVTGIDKIEDSDASDWTGIDFDSGEGESVLLVTDGVSKWRIL